MRHRFAVVLEKAKMAWHGKLLIGLSTLLFVLQGFLADFFKAEKAFIDRMAWLPFYAAHPALTTAFVLFLMVAVLCLLYTIVPTYMPVRSLTAARKPRPRRVLLLPLSRLAPAHLKNLTGDIDTDIARLDQDASNFAQVLRGIQAHRERLELVVLLGSKGEGGSHLQLSEAMAALGTVFPGLRIQPAARAIDFENVDEIYRELHRLIERLGAGEFGSRYPESEIMVDATGGQKTTSIAAALVTLHNAVSFQYVQTHAPKEVLAYELAYLKDLPKA